MGYSAYVICNNISITKPEELYRACGGEKETPCIEDVIDLINRKYDVGYWNAVIWRENQYITIDYSNKYDEDDWEELAPYVEGNIDFCGEDDFMWRHIYRNGEMDTEALRTVPDSMLNAVFKMAKHLTELEQAGSRFAIDEEHLKKRVISYAQEYAEDCLETDINEYLYSRLCEENILVKGENQ